MVLNKNTLTKIAKIEKEWDYILISDWEKIISDFTIKDDMQSAKEIYKIALKKADEFLESGISGGMTICNFMDVAISVSQKNYNVEIKNEYVERPGLNDGTWANQILEDLIPKFKFFDDLLDISRSFFHIKNKKSSIKLLEKIIDDLINGNPGILEANKSMKQGIFPGKKVSEDYSLSHSLIECADFIGGEYGLKDRTWAFKIVEESVKLSDSSVDYYNVANHVLEDGFQVDGESGYGFIYDNITLDWFKNIIIQFIEKSKVELNKSEGDWFELAFCAQYIGAKNGLNDESWSNEIYKMSFNRAKFQSENENSIFPLRDLGLHIAKHTKLKEWAKEIVQLSIDIAEKDQYYDKDDIDFYIYQVIDDIDKDWASELRKVSNKGKIGPPDKIKFRGLFYDYAELLLSLGELKEELKNAIKHKVSLSEFILDGYSGCEYGVERSFDDTFFCTAATGNLIIEDPAGNIITSFQVEDTKTLKIENKTLNHLDTFKITIKEGFRGDWKKYSLNDAISSESSFDQSLLTFSIMDDGDASLIKIIYDDIELEDYEDVIDARGKSTIVDLEYIDKNGNSKPFNPEMDAKELLKLIE